MKNNMLLKCFLHYTFILFIYTFKMITYIAVVK